MTTSCTKQQVEDAKKTVIAKGDSAYNYAENLFSNDTKQLEIKINISSSIAGAIKASNLQQIDVHTIQSYEGYKNMADNLNLAVKIINEKSGTNIKYFGKEIEDYNKFLIEVEMWTPLVNNYNELINASNNFNPASEESADMVLKKAAGFTVESVLILGGAFYKVTYMAIGEFASYFGLTKLASVCSSCVSAVMSSGHWIIRNGAIEKVSQYVEKIIP